MDHILRLFLGDALASAFALLFGAAAFDFGCTFFSLVAPLASAADGSMDRKRRCGWVRVGIYEGWSLVVLLLPRHQK